MKTPINLGILQSDLDFAGFEPVNLEGWPPGSTGSGLDENTFLAADIGMVGDGVTDNTLAFQTWLDDVGAAQENATLLVPDGVYLFDEVLQDGARRNAQVLLPSVSIDDVTYTISIKGYHPIAFIPWPDASRPMPKGPIFKSTLASASGTTPSFIGGKGPISGPQNEMSFLNVILADIIIQTVANPEITALNLSSMSTLKLLGDVLIIAGNGTGYNDVVEPTTTASCGVWFPPFNQAILQRVENLSVMGFYTGAFVGEGSHFERIGCYACHNAIKLSFSYGSSLIENLADWHCAYGIVVTNVHPFLLGRHDVERAPGGRWATRVYDIDDPGSYGVGELEWWMIYGGVGVGTDYTVNGATGIKYRRLGGDYPTIYVGTDARLTSITGGAKLQVRNPGTGLWADADQWTNP